LVLVLALWLVFLLTSVHSGFETIIIIIIISVSVSVSRENFLARPQGHNFRIGVDLKVETSV